MDIYYESYGSGPAVICLHGFNENRKIFNTLKDDLTKDYQVILIDLRYHGKSVKSGVLTLDQMAKDVMEIADHLALSSYDVIGYDTGAEVALTLASKDQRLKSAILLSPYLSPKGIKGFFRLQMMLSLVLLIPFCLYNKVARRLWKLTLWRLREPTWNKEDLAMLKQPFLLLSGDHDMMKAADVAALASALPHCVSEVLSDCSHAIFDDAYRPTLKKIRGFLYASNQTDIDN